MRSEPLSLASDGRAGLLQRLDPRWTLLGAIGLILAAVLTPLDAWRFMAFEGLILAFLIGLAGLDPIVLLRRWLALVLLAGFLAALVAPSHPDGARLGTLGVIGGLLAKNALALGAALILAGVTPLPRILTALRKLRTPPALVATLYFMDRFRHVLLEELRRMVQARRARHFRRRRGLDYGLLTGLIGVLFVRGMERAERSHAAMLARGWDGTLRFLDEADPR